MKLPKAADSGRSDGTVSPSVGRKLRVPSRSRRQTAISIHTLTAVIKVLTRVAQTWGRRSFASAFARVRFL